MKISSCAPRRLKCWRRYALKLQALTDSFVWIVVLAFGFIVVETVSAITLTWDGGYTGANGPIWNNAANWNGTAYAENSDLVFTAANKSLLDSIYLGTSHSVKSITFSNKTDLFVISLSTTLNPPGAAADLTFNSTSTGVTIQSGNANAQTFGEATDKGVVILQTNLSVAHNGDGPLIFLRPVTGAFGIIKNGSGSMFLYGSNTYSGATLVNAGKLVATTMGKGGGAVTVGDGATFGVDRDSAFLNHSNLTPSLAVSSLTLGATNGATFVAVLRDGNAATAPLIAGTLTLNGTNGVAIEGGNFSPGQFPLIKYTTKTGGGFFSAKPAGLPWGVAATISNNTANASIDLVVTAIPPNRSAALTALRVDGGEIYQSNPDDFPVSKDGDDLMMITAPVAQHVFNTGEAILELPYNGTDAYPGIRVTTANNAIVDKEAVGWHVTAGFVYREDWAVDTVTNPGGAYPVDWRLLSTAEIADIRNSIATVNLRSKDVKIIQLTGGSGPYNPNSWYAFDTNILNHLLLLDGIGTEVHVGDSDNQNENVSADRLSFLTAMAAMARWATDHGKVAMTFMGGDSSTYSDLPTTQHTFVSLWREMLRLGVDYRAANLIYIRQGGHKYTGGVLAGTHVPESDATSLTYQQKWMIQALKDTSLFVTDSGGFRMTAGTTASIPFVGGKAEMEPLTFTATSSKQSLVSNVNLTIGGRNDGLDHVLFVTPNPGQAGTATIKLIVSDGGDSVTNSFVLTVTASNAIAAAASGSINAAATWGGTLPVAGDTNIWQTGTKTISMAANAADTFDGGTLEVQAGGAFVPGIAGANLTLNNLTLNGGTINMNNNLGLTLDLSGNQFTLNSGTLKSGASGRNIVIQNAKLAGDGTINITGMDTSNSEIEFTTVQPMGFTGIFRVATNGVLNLPHIIPDKASFGLNVSGSGQYKNDAVVSLTSLVLGTNTIPPGTYRYADFTAYQKGFLLNTGGVITVVSATNTAPTFAAVPNRTLIAGQTLVVTNVATDADVPAQTLTLSLVNPPAGATLTTNGIFTWRPSIAQAPSTNVIKVQAMDNGSPRLSATNSFTVTVLKPAAPVLSGVGGGNGKFIFTVTGTNGPDYIVQASTNLFNWLPLATNSSPVLPFNFTNVTTNFPRRFYRVLLGP